MEQLHKPRDWVPSQIPEALRSQYLVENPKYLKGDGYTEQHGKNVHSLIFKNWGCVRLHGKAELRL